SEPATSRRATIRVAVTVTRVRTDQEDGDQRFPRLRTPVPSPLSVHTAVPPRSPCLGDERRNGCFRAVDLRNIGGKRTDARVRGASHPWGAAHAGITLRCRRPPPARPRAEEEFPRGPGPSGRTGTHSARLRCTGRYDDVTITFPHLPENSPP